MTGDVKAKPMLTGVLKLPSKVSEEGDIVLLHDFSRWSLVVLDVLLPELLKMGFDLREGPSLFTTRRDSRLVPSSGRL